MSNPVNAQTRYDAAPTHLLTVTPSDTADLDIPLGRAARCIWVGSPGIVRVTSSGGETVSLPAMQSGIWHPVSIRRVHATGTTASSIIVGY